MNPRTLMVHALIIWDADCALQALAASELAWVDAYHAEVWEKVSPRLSGAPLEWLRINTAPLAV